MAEFQWHNPVRTVFGTGVLDKLPELVGRRRVLLVTFQSAHATGLLARIKGLLGDRIVDIIDTVATRPELSDVIATHMRIWDERKAEVIVAVGGGSVIDFAKALCCQPESGHFLDLLTHATQVVRRLRVIAVPTTAGTGSEVTPFSIIWDTRDSNQAKYTLNNSRLWPEAALIDPELAMSLPKVVMRNSALDTLAHALEAIWNVNASPMSDMLAVEAARIVLAKLPIAWRFQGNTKARVELARAAWLAGQCLSQTRTALAHAISYPITIKQGTPHGLACSWSLPWVWRQAAGVDPARDMVLAQIFGPEEKDPIDRLEDFLHSLEVATEPFFWGLTEADMARSAIEYLSKPKGHNFISKGLRMP
ncbi:iron-containing alcohol dehydrogenase family protein [Uliginosibacterium flavum]|uniref:Phosphonoacetaldehyde reductase n=1 Tax=Uliginosibacterium flavum TaxID=1396831 RepID=A0ABV2TQQ3_9RHOO